MGKDKPLSSEELLTKEILEELLQEVPKKRRTERMNTLLKQLEI